MTRVPDASRVTAAAVVLVGMYFTLAVLLEAGYALTASVEAAGVLGVFAAEAVARLLADDGTGLPPALPPGPGRLAL